jgi:hypothetical protein
MEPMRRLGRALDEVGGEPSAGRHVDSARNRRRLAGLAVSLALVLAHVVPTVVHGQSRDQVPEAIREHYAEIVRAQVVLLALPRLFQEHPELEAQRAAFEEALVETMVGLDPDTTGRLARLGELQSQHSRAVSGGEPAEPDTALAEGRRLRDALLATAAEARGQSPVAAAAGPLVDGLRARLNELEEIDPETRELVSEGELLIETVTVMTILARSLP